MKDDEIIHDGMTVRINYDSKTAVKNDYILRRICF